MWPTAVDATMGLISISSVEAGGLDRRSGGGEGLNVSPLTEVCIKDADVDADKAAGINAAAKALLVSRRKAMVKDWRR